MGCMWAQREQDGREEQLQLPNVVKNLDVICYVKGWWHTCGVLLVMCGYLGIDAVRILRLQISVVFICVAYVGTGFIMYDGIDEFNGGNWLIGVGADVMALIMRHQAPVTPINMKDLKTCSWSKACQICKGGSYNVCDEVPCGFLGFLSERSNADTCIYVGIPRFGSSVISWWQRKAWLGILDGQEREGENTSSIERRCGKQRALDRMVFMCHVSDHQNVGSVRAFKSQSGE